MLTADRRGATSWWPPVCHRSQLQSTPAAPVPSACANRLPSDSTLRWSKVEPLQPSQPSLATLRQVCSAFSGLTFRQRQAYEMIREHLIGMKKSLPEFGFSQICVPGSPIQYGSVIQPPSPS